MTRTRSRIHGPSTAPTTPATIVNTTDSGGIPPTASDKASEIGVVTDFGAMDNAISRVPPAHAVSR